MAKREILCDTCKDYWPTTYPTLKADGEPALLYENPEEWGRLAKRTVDDSVDELVCDTCAESLLPGTTVYALTIWIRNQDPIDGWEDLPPLQGEDA